MPASVQVLKNSSVLYVRYYGVVVGDEMIRAAQEVAALSPGQTRFPVLLDLHDMENINLTYATMRGVVRKMDQLYDRRNLPGPQKTVIWAPGEVGYGMARMFEAIVQPDLRAMFLLEHEADALAALGQDAPDVISLIAQG